MLMTQRCLTCKAELPEGTQNYCNEACQLKVGRSRRAPGRTAARRRRRFGGRRFRRLEVDMLQQGRCQRLAPETSNS